jgi:hypothetical protein
VNFQIGSTKVRLFPFKEVIPFLLTILYVHPTGRQYNCLLFHCHFSLKTKQWKER